MRGYILKHCIHIFAYNDVNSRQFEVGFHGTVHTLLSMIGPLPLMKIMKLRFSSWILRRFSTQSLMNSSRQSFSLWVSKQVITWVDDVLLTHNLLLSVVSVLLLLVFLKDQSWDQFFPCLSAHCKWYCRSGVFWTLGYLLMIVCYGVTENSYDCNMYCIKM